MNMIFRILTLLACCLTAFGATPSFDSFSTNDFVTTKTTAPWLITSKRDGVTNIYNNSYITYTNSTVIFTNTTVIINGTNAATTGDLVWTNSAGVIMPSVTYDYIFGSNLFNSGWNVEYSKVVALTNGVNLVRSDLYAGLQVLGATTTASDSIVQFRLGPFTGATIKLQSGATANQYTVPNNYAVVGGGVTIMNGDWIGGTNQVLRMTFDGWNWKEEGRYVQGGPPPIQGTNYWTNIAGVLQPLDLNLQPMISNGLFVGTNSETAWGAPLTGGQTLVSYRVVSEGDPNLNMFALGAAHDLNLNDYGAFTILLQTNRSDLVSAAKTNNLAIGWYLQSHFDPYLLSLQGRYLGNTILAFEPTASDGTTPFSFDTTLTHTTGNLVEFDNNGTNRLAVRFDGQVTASSPTDQIDFVAQNASGKEAHFGVTAGNQVLIQPSAGASGVTISDGTTTNNIVHVGGALQPSNSNVALGTLSSPWAGAHFTNALGSTNYIYFGTNTLSIQGSDLYWNATKLN